MRRVAGFAAVTALVATLSIQTITAQTAVQAQDHVERKVISKIAPFYPELARHMHLGGMVKLEVVVRPDGKVKSAKAIGGSPILLQSAIEAVEKWRFETAPAESTEAVQIVFESTP
jgi:TonB family protein